MSILTLMLFKGVFKKTTYAFHAYADFIAQLSRIHWEFVLRHTTQQRKMKKKKSIHISPKNNN